MSLAATLRCELIAGAAIDALGAWAQAYSRNHTITVYGRTDEGDDPPLRIIGPNTGLLNPRWIYVDTENNEIFITNNISIVW